MATGDLITGDWQMERGGLLVGDGTDYDIRQIAGLADSAPVKPQDRELTGKHGAVAGSDFLAARTFVIDLEVVDDSTSSMTTKVAALNAAFVPAETETEIAFQIPGVAAGELVQVSGRVRRRAVPVNLEHANGLARVAVQIDCTDPRIYSQVERSEEVGLATTGGGASFDATFDLSFGAVSTGGTMNAVNAGDFQAPMTVRIDGPCTTPILEHTDTGRQLKLNLTVASGDYILLDSDARTVLLNGTASRYSSLDSSSVWFGLAAGSNPLDFRAATGTGATCTVTWRDTWA